MNDLLINHTSYSSAAESSAARARRMHCCIQGDQSMTPDFESLDEASHDLYLRGQPGPIRCRVDGSIWDVWQDGRSALVGEIEVV